MKAVVAIPTYNERENIRPLIEAIMGLGDEIYAIIVDDNSPDGTGAIADDLARQFPRTIVIHRRGKGGRGSACIAAFQHALQWPDCDYFLEMDADFSHDPRDIPRFLAAMPGYDVVIGSRYIPGSKIVHWGIQRHIFSRLANGFARLVLGVPIHDYTNGYRCYSRHALELVDFSRIEAHGYIVLSEMAYQLHRHGARFREIPIVFVNRQRGTSNTSLGEIVEAFTSVIRLRIKYHRFNPRLKKGRADDTCK